MSTRFFRSVENNTITSGKHTAMSAARRRKNAPLSLQRANGGFHYNWTGRAPPAYDGAMKKPFAYFMILFVLSIVIFGTWQLFLGNLEAAYSSFPFLLIAFVFLKSNGK